MSDSATRNAEIQELLQQKYRHGFVTDIESDTLPPGLDEDVIRIISARKGEPEFLLEWRLRAYRYWREGPGAILGETEYSAHRLPGNFLLLRARPGQGRAQEPGRGRSSLVGDLRQAGHPTA